MGFFVSMDRRRIVTVLATLAIAFATGHIMQTLLVSQDEVSVRGDAPDAAPQVRGRSGGPSLPTPPAATLTPFVPPEPLPSERIPDDPPLTEFEQEDARFPAFEPPCAIDGAAREVAGGSIRLTIDAPCLAGLPVTVAQGSLRIGWSLDETGWLSVEMPALARMAEVSAALAGGDTLEWGVEFAGPIPRRVALGTDGADGLRLSGPAERLGDGSGPVVWVKDNDGPVEIEADVTAETCGQDLRGEITWGGTVEAVSISMPGCEALGEIVVLPLGSGDRRIASN